MSPCLLATKVQDSQPEGGMGERGRERGGEKKGEEGGRDGGR